MPGHAQTIALEYELAQTRQRLAEAEQTLHAIRSGEVDAIVVHGASGAQTYTLQDATEPYRQIIEQMHEAALSVTSGGVIVYCNRAFSTLTRVAREQLVGTSLSRFISPDEVAPLLSEAGSAGCDLSLNRPDGTHVECHASSAALRIDVEIINCVVLTDLSRSEERLRLALEASGAGTWEIVLDTGEFIASDRALDLHGLAVGAPATQASILAAIYPADQARVAAALHDAIETSAPLRVEARVIHPDGSTRWIASAAEVHHSGRHRRLYGLVRDITEHKQHEQQVLLLMQEVNHRSKNLLALVLAVARQTAGNDAKPFVKRFSDRVHALAISQDLLVSHEWTGVNLIDLVRAQLSHFKDLIGTRINITGGAVRLSPAAAQTLGMALHELATNASKYGGLSNDVGEIAISWRLGYMKTGTPNDRRLEFTWQESNGPRVATPTRRGFGTTVTEQMVRVSLSAEVDATYADRGFRWHFTCPADRLLLQD